MRNNHESYGLSFNILPVCPSTKSLLQTEVSYETLPVTFIHLVPEISARVQERGGVGTTPPRHPQPPPTPEHWRSFSPVSPEGQPDATRETALTLPPGPPHPTRCGGRKGHCAGRKE